MTAVSKTFVVLFVLFLFILGLKEIEGLIFHAACDVYNHYDRETGQ